jgi:hypothetical protein
MAGNAPAFIGRPAYLAIDKLSKNTLIDLVSDLCRREIGETASDAEVVAWIEKEVEPVHLARHQRFVGLVAAMNKYEKSDEAYRIAHPEFFGPQKQAVQS